MDHAVRDVEVVFVVADDDEGLAAGTPLGKDLEVERLLEMGVLVRRPLVEDADRADPRGGQPGARAASAGPATGRWSRRCPRSTRTSPSISSRANSRAARSSSPSGLEAQERLEQVAVGEDDREELAVVLQVVGGDGSAIELNRPVLAGVEARDQLDQGRLAAAVAARPGRRSPRGEASGRSGRG